MTIRRTPIRALAAALSLAALAACAPPSAPPGAPAPGGVGALPPIPTVAGPLAIDVVYPAENAQLTARDSNFIFGNVGTGQATLTIDGTPVEVAPNGAFLAFLPIPQDGSYELAASAAGQTTRLTRTVRLPALPAPPAAPAPTAAAPAAPPPPDPTRVGVVATQRADGSAIGTAVPGSGTPYHWFFPNTTRLQLEGTVGGQYRVRLTPDLTVWVDTAEVDLLPEGTPLPRGAVGSVVADPAPGWVDIRLGTSQRLPFQVEGGEHGLTITVYGAETRTNILQYGATDPLLRRLDWEAVSDYEYRVHADLTEPLWGYETRWDANGHLVVRVRRPPPIDPQQPLRGIRVAVDAGHPPGGAIGPTRLTEAEATLAVTTRLVPLLQARGATVIEIRPGTEALGVTERVQMANEAGAHLFVSVHFDAFGDGTNPFTHYGTHVLFNQPHSLDFARAMQRELVPLFGLPDLGVRRQDVAVIRNSTLPSVLTETMFMMFPAQEAALRNPAALERIAEAHVRGIESFLLGRRSSVVGLQSSVPGRNLAAGNW